MGATIHGGVTFERFTSGFKVTLDAPSGLSGNRTFYLPTSYGSSGNVLKSDGTGGMSFGAIAWSEIGSKPTTLAGFGITDGVVNTRAVNTGPGLTGGGNLTADRTINLNFTALSTEAAPDPNADYCIIVTAGGSHKRTLLNLLPTGAPDVYWADILSKPTTLAGFGITDAVSNSIGVYGGTGLNGGGVLTGNRTLNLDIPGLGSYPTSPDGGIQIAVEKTGFHYRMAISSLFSINSVSSGYGTSGGGLLSTNPTIELALSDLTLKTSGLSSAWHVPIVDATNTQWKTTVSAMVGLFSVSAGSGLSGGGALNSSPSLALDINGLTVDGSPSSSDYLATYDVSSGGLKKVTISSLPISGGGGASYSVTEITLTSQLGGSYPNYTASVTAGNALLLNCTGSAGDSLTVSMTTGSTGSTAIVSNKSTINSVTVEYDDQDGSWDSVTLASNTTVGFMKVASGWVKLFTSGGS